MCSKVMIRIIGFNDKVSERRKIMLTLLDNDYAIQRAPLYLYCKLLSALVRAFILFHDNGKKQR